MTEIAAPVAIASEGLRAWIDPMGAQLSALRDADGLDLLWDGDPAIWASRAPILFPIVGEVAGGAYRVDGKTYHLPRHGLARRRAFSVVAQTPHAVTFRLSADEASLAVYPFAFELDMIFALSGTTLAMIAEIRNRGAAPMPASFGFHPAFCWPLPYLAERSAHQILFDKAEPAPVRRISPEGLVKAQTYPSPVEGRVLPLSDDLFVDDALILDQLASPGLTYGPPEGRQLKIDFPGAPYLGLWTKPNAPFVCVEPWWGIADPEGFTGELADKPGMMIVPPGGVRSVAMTVTLTGG